MPSIEDIRALLQPEEIPFLEKAVKNGIPAMTFYQKLREFKVTYPDSWKEPFGSWIKGSKGEQGRAERIRDLQDQIRLAKVKLIAKKKLDEEKLLAEELEALNKALKEG